MFTAVTSKTHNTLRQMNHTERDIDRNIIAMESSRQRKHHTFKDSYRCKLPMPRKSPIMDLVMNKDLYSSNKSIEIRNERNKTVFTSYR